MKIAIFLTEFPSPSEVPVLNFIISLINYEPDVKIFADRSNDNLVNHADFASQKLLNKTAYFPNRPITNHKNIFINKILLHIKTLPYLLKSLFIAPKITLRSINIFRYGAFASSYYLFYNAYPFIINSYSFDIIHAQFGPNGEKAALLKEIGAISGKLITSFRGYDINTIPQSNSIFKNYKWLKRFGETYTADSNFIKNKLIENGFPEKKIEVIHSAIQIEKFNPSDTQVKEKIRLISVGRLVECKGYEYAIKAMPIINQSLPNKIVEYIIVGGGQLWAELNLLIKRLDLNNVTLKGWLSQGEVIQELGKSDIFIHPAIIGADGAEEAQGLVLQEAQAMHLPVIASNIGGISEGMLDSETGFLVPQKDENSIANRVIEIINGNLFLKFGKQGREFVVEEFSQEKQTLKMLNIYRKT